MPLPPPPPPPRTTSPSPLVASPQAADNAGAFLPSFLSHLSSTHTWYDYSTQPTMVDEDEEEEEEEEVVVVLDANTPTPAPALPSSSSSSSLPPPSSTTTTTTIITPTLSSHPVPVKTRRSRKKKKKNGKGKQSTTAVAQQKRQQQQQLTLSDILALAQLLPSTRPLLSSQAVLKALGVHPEEAPELAKRIKEEEGPRGGKPASNNGNNGNNGNTTTTNTNNNNNNNRRRSKLEELREREIQLAQLEDAARAEKQDLHRKREIDTVLGLGEKIGPVVPMTYAYGELISGTPGITAGGEVEKPRKKRRMEEIDGQLGLSHSEVGGFTVGNPINKGIAASNRVALRRAAIDALLGLIDINGISPAGAKQSTELDNEGNLSCTIELTKRQIDEEMNLLDSGRMAQIDLILGLKHSRSMTNVETRIS